MKLRVSFFLFTVVCLGFAFFFFGQKAGEEEVKVTDDASRVALSVASTQLHAGNPVQKATKAAPVTGMVVSPSSSQDEGVSGFNSPDSLLNEDTIFPWQTPESVSGDGRNFPHAKVSQYAAVELDEQSSLAIIEGDQVAIRLPNGETATFMVMESGVNESGEIVWNGYLEGYGDRYPIVYTQGEQSAFAMITTPEGSFSMESVNGVGWIYKNPSEIELSDPNRPDGLIPERKTGG